MSNDTETTVRDYTVTVRTPRGHKAYDVAAASASQARAVACRNGAEDADCPISLVQVEEIRRVRPDVTVELVQDGTSTIVRVDGYELGRVRDGQRLVQRADKILRDAGVSRQGYTVVDGVLTATGRQY
jgi:hypothetical protein